MGVLRSRWRRPVAASAALLSAALLLGGVAPSGAGAATEGGNVSVVEGDSGTTDAVFVVALSTPVDKPVRVAYSTSDGTATAGEDYQAVSGAVGFRPGETRRTVLVPVTGDQDPEGDEFFFFNLDGSQARATIVDNDPFISIGAATITEGDEGRHDASFLVVLAVPQGRDDSPGTSTTSTAPGGRFPRSVDVRYQTSNGTAVAGTDYEATQGTVHFAAGERSKLISVPVFGDLDPERDEVFYLNLSEPSRGQIDSVQGTGIILNDDPVALVGEPPAASTQPGGPVPPGSLPERFRSVTSAGQVIPFGAAATFGPTLGPLNRPIVGAANSPSGQGYWLVASDGGVFAYGDSQFFGSTGAMILNQPIVGLAPTPSGQGYLMVASDGGVFTFGDAKFFGSTGDIRLNSPIVDIAATPSGNGYWMVTARGGVFSFGDARFVGSAAGQRLNGPIVGITGSASGDGYWLVAADGGVFAFGDAPFLGSGSGSSPGQRIVGLAATPTGTGYWLLGAQGGLLPFGDAPPLTRPPLPAPTELVGIAF